MTKHINLHKNYTTNQEIYVLNLPRNIDIMIPDNDSVRSLSQFVELSHKYYRQIKVFGR